MGPPLSDSQGESEPLFEIGFGGDTLSCTSLCYCMGLILCDQSILHGAGTIIYHILGLGPCTIYFQFMGTYFQVKIPCGYWID